MPATSQQQQKLFGLALSVKRGETPRSEASEDVLNIVDSMTEKEIEDFAGTSHKGLPKKVEEVIREEVRAVISENIPRMYKVYLGVQKKLRTMEDEQKKMLAQFKSEKDPKKKRSILDKMKDGTKRLQKVRANLDDIENEYINQMSYDTSYSESVNEGYGDWIKAKNLTDIINLSKKKKNAVFYVTDDNNSRIGSFYLKNGKFAKATTANASYDLQNSKTSLRDRSDVIYKYKVDESVNKTINERLTTSDMKYMDGLALRKPLDIALKELRKVGQDLIDSEGFEKSDVKEFLLSKVSRVLHVGLSESTQESVNEVASRTAVEIGALTGLNKNAVQDFVDKHDLDIEKVYKSVKSMNLAGRMNFVTAVAGKPGNSLQKLAIKLNKKK